jgi:3-dehydrosphinganine reductase
LNNTFIGKWILITGGSSGIGLAIAGQLAGMGANVCVLARDADKLAAALSRIEPRRISPQQKFATISADVSNETEVTSRIQAWVSQTGVPDFLFNAAGVAHPGCCVDLDTEIYRWMMDVDYFGTVYVTKAILPDMIQRKSGYIINFSSIAGLLGVYGYTAYGAAKFAVKGFTSALRDEMRLHGIRVSVVYPPDVQTPQLEYELPYKPAITRIIAGSKPISAENAARSIIQGVMRKQFSITPGFDATLYHLAISLAGWLEKPLMDFLVDDAQRKINSTQSSTNVSFSSE